MDQQLLSVPPQDRDLEWIKASLQSAVALEHATLPLYLAAMFSLEIQNYTTYNLIRSVVMEEMVHMAIGCNILAALGEKPSIKKLDPLSPSEGLPGGVEPDLPIVFAQLSKNQLQNFLRLETPISLLAAKYKDEKYPSIGAFYSKIKVAISANADEINATAKKVLSAPANTYPNQVGDNIGFTVFSIEDKRTPVQQFLDGIDEIVEQGEGSNAQDLYAQNFDGEGSHYARFAEIYYGAQLLVPTPEPKLTPETETEFFKGHQIPWPNVTNVLAIPRDGYKKLLELDPEGASVKSNLCAFDDKYTEIMTDLDLMWNGPAEKSWPTFGKAVAAMTDLRVLSCFNIMRSQIPANLIARLPELYGDEAKIMARYTDLSAPVFYGPRFINRNA
ncbi:ferritin-like domain-containing protein [Pseudovibrio ascidiaceicola]|uniref:ferritin-like domain-containing protein n=1 Tax=Pseudovibrio ascidiaceicola TaxID=285279 RepID=UPI001AD9376B|nr:ferritin-like protein [Pseudovibrio ascidiaceicola]